MAPTVSEEAGYAWGHPAEAAIISVGGVRSLARTVNKAEAEGTGYHALGELIFDVATAGVGAEPGLARDATELAAVPEGATLGTQAAEATSRVAVGVGEASTEGALGSATAATAEADSAARAASATSATASTAAEPALGTGDLAGGRHTCSCFPAGTQVDTSRGKQRIATLKVGDNVLAEDPKTGKVEPEPVQRVIDDGVEPLLALDLSDGSTLRVTSNHPFRVDGNAPMIGGIVRAPSGEMNNGDATVGTRSVPGRIVSFEHKLSG